MFFSAKSASLTLLLRFRLGSLAFRTPPPKKKKSGVVLYGEYSLKSRFCLQILGVVLYAGKYSKLKFNLLWK